MKYYFKLDGNLCLENCEIVSDTKIGSNACRKCFNYISSNKDPQKWIDCKYLNIKERKRKLIQIQEFNVNI